MEFSQGVFLVGVISFFLFLVAAGMSRLAKKIDAVMDRLDEPREVINVLAAPAEDPIVHDYHSDNDEFESVTKRAERAWG
jgi:hypothetical protein